MNDNQLIRPLTEAELQRLAEYDRKQQASDAATVAIQISGWSEKAQTLLFSLALNDWENQDRRQLVARRDYEARLDQITSELEALIFAPLQEDLPMFETRQKTNLPALIAKYEGELQHRTTPASRREYAAYFLRSLLPKKKQRATFATYDATEGRRRSILDDALNRLRENIKAHVTGSLDTALAPLPVAPMAALQAGGVAFHSTTIPMPDVERLPIDKHLAIPRSVLDRLLLEVAMIEPSPLSGRYSAKENVKPWQWANVRAALQQRLLLTELNDAEAAQLFKETYSAKVSRGTMQGRPHAADKRRQTTRRVLAYREFYDRLPARESL